MKKFYRYDPLNGELSFEDSISYTLREAVLLAKSKPSPRTLRALHDLKGVFDGEVYSYGKSERSPVEGIVFAETAGTVLLEDMSLQNKRLHKKRNVPGLRKLSDVPDVEQTKLQL